MEQISGVNNWKLVIRGEPAGVTILRAETCDRQAKQGIRQGRPGVTGGRPQNGDARRLPADDQFPVVDTADTFQRP